MKSLVESLFDKDLVKRKLTIRDGYKIMDTVGIQTSGFHIGQMFDPVKLEHYPNKYDVDYIVITSAMTGLLGIIVDQPIPKDNDEKWSDNLKKILTKYIKRSWKKEWDENIDIENVEIKLSNKKTKGIIVLIKMNDGLDGYIMLSFEPIS